MHILVLPYSASDTTRINFRVVVVRPWYNDAASSHDEYQTFSCVQIRFDYNSPLSMSSLSKLNKLLLEQQIREKALINSNFMHNIFALSNASHRCSSWLSVAAWV
jgi:hypothetical protein